MTYLNNLLTQKFQPTTEFSGLSIGLYKHWVSCVITFLKKYFVLTFSLVTACHMIVPNALLPSILSQRIVIKVFIIIFTMEAPFKRKI